MEARMILDERDIPVVHLCWDGTEAEPTLLDLEHWRDQLADRLARLCRESDPHTVEGFGYVDWRHASEVRGRLTLSLLDNIERLNARIREIILPEAA